MKLWRKEEIAREVLAIFREEFEDDDGRCRIDRSTILAELPMWDDFEVAEIGFLLEDEFDIDLATDTIESWRTIDDVINHIWRSKGFV